MKLGNSLQGSARMGTMPVGRLLFQVSLPMIISMLVSALYNIVDSMYVAQYSANALTAISLVYSMQMLISALANGTAVGINALVSRFLGSGETEKAGKVAKTGIFLAIVTAIIVAVVMLIIPRPFLAIQTTDPEIYSYGVTYLTIIGVFYFGLMMQNMLERLLTATGNTVFTMIAQAAGAVTNIILDPILIFGWFGLPEMGVMGAAIATVIGQWFGMLLALIFNLKFNKELNINMRGFRPDRRLIGQIYGIGIPSIVLGCVSPIMTFCMNIILSRILLSSVAVSVFGVFYKLNSFLEMPVFGLNSGLVPICAYNYGARKRKRIVDTYKIATIVGTSVMMIGVVLAWLIPEQLLGLYNANAEMLAIGVPALKILSLSIFMAAYCVIAGSLFQSLGSAVYALIIALVRQLLVLVPVAIAFALIFHDITLVWWSLPISEVVAVLMTIVFYIKVYNKKLKPLPL